MIKLSLTFTGFIKNAYAIGIKANEVSFRTVFVSKISLQFFNSDIMQPACTHIKLYGAKPEIFFFQSIKRSF